MTPIFHIAEASLWADAARTGSYTQSTRGATLEEVGYIHCSFAHQIATVADAVYADCGEPLVLLEIDPARLLVPVRVENLDGGAEEFPHVYGPVSTDAVVAVRPCARVDGTWTW